MNSRIDTTLHIINVQNYMKKIIKELVHRGKVHDKSKLESPEVEIFDEYTPLLKNTTYGSDEYKELLQKIKPALDHHYSKNSHHPEFWKDGIRGMSLVDLIEMICDWKAASLRHHDGDVNKSIEINQKRFGYSDELKQIFYNTLLEIEDD